MRVDTAARLEKIVTVHTTVLRSDEFDLTVQERPATIADVFPEFDEHDRLGIVLGADNAAAGAAALILATVTAFYDRLRAQTDDFFTYPDYFAFHVGRPHGSLRKLDVFPSHKEVVVPAEAEEILRAINDRGVTRLLVPDAPSGGRAPGPQLSSETRASAERRIRSVLAYSPTGRARDADVAVTGSPRSESFVSAMLEQAAAPAIQRRRSEHPRESFRRIDIDQALGMLAPAPG
jgi:hypothetical protein